MKKICAVFLTVALVSVICSSCAPLPQEEEYETATITISNDSAISITRIVMWNNGPTLGPGFPPNEVDDDEPLEVGKSRSFRLGTGGMGSWKVVVYSGNAEFGYPGFQKLEKDDAITFSFDGSSLVKK